MGASISALTANLPDLLEPASSPHHRQFFHSIFFGGFTIVASVKIYQWQLKDDFEEALRYFLLAVSSAYLIHLAADSLTRRSLPLIGKI